MQRGSTVRLARFAMATRFEVLLVGRDRVRLQAAGEEALREIDLVERELSRFRKDSVLRFLERQGERRPLRLGADFFGLLSLCREVHERSAGAFDVTVAPLLDAPAAAGAPEGPERAAGFEAVRLDPRREEVRLAGPVRFDLGAVGKGHALDRAAEVLRERGVADAFLHGGTSSSLALGRGPGGTPWRVAVRDPAGGGVLATVDLEDAAFSVSATHGGPRGGTARHLVDPRTCRPVAGHRLAAVRSPSAASADAWSTALLVAGPEVGIAGAALYWQDGVPTRVLGGPGVFVFPAERTVA